MGAEKRAAATEKGGKSAAASRSRHRICKRRKEARRMEALGSGLALGFTLLVLPLFLLVGGVLRVSLVSAVFVLLALSYIAWSNPRPPTGASFVRPLLCVLLAAASMVVEGVHLAHPLGTTAQLLLGLVDDTPATHTELVLYFLADGIAAAGAVIAVVVLGIVRAAYARARAVRNTIPTTAPACSADGTLVRDGTDEFTVVEAEPAKPASRARHDSSSSSSSDTDSDTEKEDEDDAIDVTLLGDSGDDGPVRTHFIPTISYGRAVLALVAAMCAASFAPSVLAAPYALFVVATCIFVAWPRKQYTVVNLPLWTSAAGIAVFAYAALHTLVVYGFQFYYRHLLMDQDVATSSVSISSDSDSISDVVDTTVVASPSVGWMGLFDYDTFLTGDHWMVCVSFVFTVVLLFAISPAVRSFKRVSDTKAALLRKRYACPDLLTPVLSLSYRQAAKAANKTKSKSKANSAMDPRKVILAAIYPHGWKLGIAIVFFICLVSPGIPTYVCLALLLASTFAAASFSAATSIPFFIFTLVLICAQYFFATNVPPAQYVYDTKANLLNDLSLPLRTLPYCGLFFTLCFCGLYVIAVFIRIHYAHRAFELIAPTLVFEDEPEKKKAEHKEKKPAKVARKKAPKKEAPKKPVEEEIDPVDDDRDPYAEPMAPTSKQTTTTTTTSKPIAKESSAARLKRNISSMYNFVGKKSQDTGNALKKIGLTVLVNALRYSYFLSLLALYFTAVHGSNVLNAVLMVFFLVFLVKPSWAQKGWVVFLAYVDVVFLVRCIWQLQWIPEDGTVTTIIGIEKDRSQAPIKLLVWEVVLVVCATIQLFFLRMADVTEATQQARKSKDGKTSAAKSEVQGMARSSTLDSIAEVSKVTWISNAWTVVLHCLQHGGLFLCCVVWALCGILMPLSIASLMYLVLSFICILYVTHVKRLNVHLKRMWIVFLIWEALVLCCEYVFQCTALQDIVVEAYQKSKANEYIGLDEIGLLVFETSGQRYAGMLPYVITFVLSILQMHLFSVSNKSELPEGTMSPVATGIVDFVCRFFFAYSPLIMYVFSAAQFVQQVSLVHLVFLFIMMVSRLGKKGLDIVSVVLLWLCQLFVLCTLVFNMKAFDSVAIDYAPLFRWIGLAREYVPGGSTGAHGENMRMVYEYIVIFILICIERRSLKWGVVTAKRIGWCADCPRNLPLFRFLDTLPSWSEEERAAHPWMLALNVLCNFPLYLTKQAMFVILLVCFYLRSATLLGIVYIITIAVCMGARKEKLRRLAPWYAVFLVALISFQYVCTLGSPSLTGTIEWPWISLASNLQQWLLLYVPHPVLLICDALLLYFVTAVWFLSPTDPDFFALVQPQEREDFPNPPRTLRETVRYVFFRVVTVIIILAMLIVGLTGGSIVALVFLFAALAMLNQQDYILTRYRPWKGLMVVCYILIVLQLCIQLVYIMVNSYASNPEKVLSDLKIATVFLGVDFTTQDQLYPTHSVLLLTMALLVLSFLRSLYLSSEDALYKTRVYNAEMNLKAEQRAMEYNSFKTDVVIHNLEAIFAEKAERRRRLETLRESRKRKRLLFPDLMAEISDNASTMSGGSLLSANEALYRANVKEASESDGKTKKKNKKDKEEKVKVPFKTRFKNFWRPVGRFCKRIIDVVIFWLHGKEGECEGSRYGHDLLILRQEHEELVNSGKKKKPKNVDPTAGLATAVAEGTSLEAAKRGEKPTTTTTTTTIKHEKDTKGVSSGMALTQEALALSAQFSMIESFVNEVSAAVPAVSDEHKREIACPMVKCATDSECVDILGDFTVSQLVAMVQSGFEGHDDVREMLATLQTLDDSDSTLPSAAASDKCPFTLGAFVYASASRIAVDVKLAKVANEVTMGALFKYITFSSSNDGNDKSDSDAGNDSEKVTEKEQQGEDNGKKPGRKSRWHLFYTGLGVFIGTCSESICMLAFLINFLVQGTILSSVYVFFGFGYVAISRRPHPLKPFWTFICVYTAVIIALKSIVQLPGMCTCHSSAIHIWYFSKQLVVNRTRVTCPELQCVQDSGTTAGQFSPPYFFGLVTQKSFLGTNMLWDIIVLIAVLFHMRQMIKQGLWNDATCEKIEKDKERFVERLNELKIEDATASPTEVEAIEAVQGINEHYLSFGVGTVIHVISRSSREGATSIGELDGVTGLFDIKMTKPYIPASALIAARKRYRGEDHDDDDDDTDLLGESDAEDKKKKKKTKDSKKGKKDKRKTFKYFYDNLVHDSTRLGKDYYTPMFFCEFVCFVYLLFAASTFTGSSGALVEYIKQSYLPGAYVIVLLLQFVFIIVDRIVYLRRSVVGKLVLQYLTLVLYNVLCLWYFPSKMAISYDYEKWNSGFSSSSTLQVFYLFKCLYWFFSGMQIREGYPMLSCDRFLMRKFGLVHNWIHTGYRCIPFVYEMRTILDWTFIPTTLDFFDYLRVEDIYAELYNVGCLVSARTPRKPGQPQTNCYKCSCGCLFFVVIVIIIWLPLILLSSSVPGLTGTVIAPVSDAELTVSVKGLPPFYDQFVSAEAMMSVPISGSDFSYLRRGHTFVPNTMNSVQRTQFAEYSSVVWEMTPPGKKMLYETLKNESNPLGLEAKLTFTRSSASNSVVTYNRTTYLTKQERRAFLSALTAGNGSSVTVSGLLPRYIKTPGSTGDATSPCDVAATAGQCETVNFTLTYYGCFDGACAQTDWGNEYWGILQVPEDTGSIFTGTTPDIITVHTPVSSSSNVLGTIAAYGLIGIYATIILAIANLIRGMTSGLAHRIMFVVLPNPYDLLQLCHDIILARMDGDLLLEEELSNELIQIYRSPESIIEHTRIPIPPEEQDDLDADLPVDVDDDNDDDNDDDYTDSE